MADSTLDPQDVARKARALIESDVNARVNAVSTIVSAANDADAAADALAAANAAHENAWKAALTIGWSEKELKTVGARAPGQTARRPRPKSAAPASRVAPVETFSQD